MGSRNGGMAKLLMKKLGTPSGAGPGRAKENVGLDGPGTPGPVIPVWAVGAAFLVLAFFLVTTLGVMVAPVVSLPGVLFGLPKVEELLRLAGVGDEEGVGVWGVVVVGVVEVVVGVVVTVTVGAGGVVVVPGGQMALTLWTGGVPGGSIAEPGVPGAAFTVKVTTWPSSSVAVTVHWSAEALGIAATAIVARAHPTVTTATFSLWLIDTGGLSPPATNLDRVRIYRAASQAR